MWYSHSMHLSNHLVPKNEINTRVKALNKYNSELKTQANQIKITDQN
jgi:hypothetical protein